MSANRRVLITGATGQDGAYLAELLLQEGCEVHCGFRRGGSHKVWRLEALGILDRVRMVELEVTEFHNLLEVIQETQPDIVFHLAAQSFVLDSHKYPALTTNVNAIGTLNVLEALRIAAPEAYMFNASTSELYGTSVTAEVDENSSFDPCNPYSISKLHAHLLVRNHRDAYGMRCSSGILFNHESPLRGREFVSRKITFNMARLLVEDGPPVRLGNLDAVRDWGAAKDYVRAMYMMAIQDKPMDYVIASGSGTTVRQFLTTAANCAGFDLAFEGEGLNEVGIDSKTGKQLVVVNENYYRARDTGSLIGNASSLRQTTGWTPQITLDQLIEEMVTADTGRRKSGDIHV